MTKFDGSHFTKIKFGKDQVEKNINNALKDLKISKTDNILEVKFNYAYTALVKTGVALLSSYNVKVRSVPGHHIKILEKMAEILKDETIEDIGNIMRSKRNLDLYAGGIEVTEKECNEYIPFVENVIEKAKKIIL